jgi:hypothetical protein
MNSAADDGGREDKTLAEVDRVLAESRRVLNGTLLPQAPSATGHAKSHWIECHRCASGRLGNNLSP